MVTAPSQPIAGRGPITGYGPGSFRTGSVQHRGSILILPQGVLPWAASVPADITPQSLAEVLAAGASLGFLLLGTGAAQIFPSGEVRAALASAGLALEVMDTGAACRTYNLLLAEERSFAAALLAMPG